MSQFQAWLKEKMEEQDLNLSELALKLGVSDVTVGYWVRGVRRPDVRSVANLARFFKVSPARIYTDLGLLPTPPRDDVFETLVALWDQIPEWKRRDLLWQAQSYVGHEIEL